MPRGSRSAAPVAAFLAVLGGMLWFTVGASGGQAIGRITDGQPEAIVVVTRDGTLSSWRSSGSARVQWRCGYYAVVAPQLSVLDPSPVVDWESGPVTPVPGEFYMLGCTDGTGARVHSRYVPFNPQDPFGGAAATPRAVDEARRRLELPDPRPEVNPPTEQLVGLPMWMWVDQSWEPVSVTASIGSVWAEVTAWPEASLWSFEDGSRVVCGRGVAYDIRLRPEEQNSECVKTFSHSSLWLPGGVEWVRVTVLWRVSWRSSESSGELLGTLEKSVELPVRVREAQAVIR